MHPSSSSSASSVRPNRRVPQRTAFALLLAGVAGSVDAIGYLTLAQLFIAHMSGSTVRVGIFISQGSWGNMFERAFPIPMLVLGVIVGGFLTELGLRAGARTTLSAMLLLECALLGAFAIYGRPLLTGASVSPNLGARFYLLVALPALAVGIQNAALRRIGGATVRTTFVTGMLMDMAEAGVAYAFWLRDRLAGVAGRHPLRVLRVSFRQESFSRFTLYAGIWLLYVIGAVAGAFAQPRWTVGAVLLPVGVLAIVAAWNAFWPIQPPVPR